MTRTWLIAFAAVLAIGNLGGCGGTSEQLNPDASTCDPQVYPCVPYGVSPGTVIRDLSFLGWRDDNKNGSLADDELRTIHLSDYFADKQIKVLVVTAAILTAIAVSVAGIIAFVGLIIPHLVRLMVGPNHRRVLPFSLLMGAALMGIADLMSRTLLAPTEIPVGVVTTFIGAPVFIYLLRRGRRT